MSSVSHTRSADCDIEAFATTIARIRALEEELLDLFSRGHISGTTHTSIGQEVCTAALFSKVDPQRDAVFSSHRCHGHFLAFGGSVRELLAEIMGKRGGVCHGRGGSQHLCYGRFFSNGIVGGGVPIAAGYAERLKAEGKGAMAVSIIGDGALGQGVVYEALNLAAVRRLPLLLVVEHNGYAQSTDTRTTTAGDIVARMQAFGIAVDRRAATDPVDLATHYEMVVNKVRAGEPFVQIVDTFRLMAHSKGDDNRPTELIEAARERDFFNRKLAANDPVFTAAWQAAKQEVKTLAAELIAAPDERLTAPSCFPPRAYPLEGDSAQLVCRDDETSRMRVSELLNRGMHRAMHADETVMMIGEDIADPYGGAFKVSRGLSDTFPARVFSTPIAEAGITGFANGVALAGGRPVVEIMFGDFSTLVMDQIINNAAKFHFMYGGQVSLPLTLRVVSGGYRGYGATHSQSMEAYFCGTPGFKVVAISGRHNVEEMLTRVVLYESCPTILVENKQLYAKRPQPHPPRGFRFVSVRSNDRNVLPPLYFTTDLQRADVTVITYGGLTEMVETALDHLILEEELHFDYFVLSQLSPLDVTPLVQSAAKTKRVITVEEGPVSFGIGAEIVAGIAKQLNGKKLQTARVGARDLPIPSSSVQEREVLPSVKDVLQAIIEIL